MCAYVTTNMYLVWTDQKESRDTNQMYLKNIDTTRCTLETQTFDPNLQLKVIHSLSRHHNTTSDCGFEFVSISGIF